jgi:hypothetical protein
MISEAVAGRGCGRQGAMPLDSLDARVAPIEYTRSPVFFLFFTRERKILTRLVHPARRPSAKIAAVEGGHTMNRPLIAQFLAVHVNFAAEDSGQSPNRQDDADT